MDLHLLRAGALPQRVLPAGDLLVGLPADQRLEAQPEALEAQPHREVLRGGARLRSEAAPPAADGAPVRRGADRGPAAFAASALLLYAGFRVYNRDSLFAFLLLAGLLALLLWMLYRFARGNRETARDIGALVGQIAAVHAGGLTMPLDLPEDADLAAAAKDLNDIQRGDERGARGADAQRADEGGADCERLPTTSRRPLTSIISYVELLGQEEELPEHVKDYIRILESKSQRLKTMVQDVFEVSKAASGQLPVTLETLDLGKLLRQTLADNGRADRPQHGDGAGGDPRGAGDDHGGRPAALPASSRTSCRTRCNIRWTARGCMSASRRTGPRRSRASKNTSREEIARNKDFTERFVRGDDARTDGGSGLGLSNRAYLYRGVRRALLGGDDRGPLCRDG